MQEHGRWLTGTSGARCVPAELESYNKTWLGVAALAETGVLIAAMLLINAADIGYRHYTAEFLPAAALKPGNPITVAGIPVGKSDQPGARRRPCRGGARGSQ